MTKGYTLVFFTAIISGAALYLNKFAVDVINPYVFTGLKNLTVTMLLILLILGLGKLAELKRLPRRQWGKLVLVGLVGGGLPFLLFFKGLSISAATNGAFIHKTLFIWAAILAIIFLKEKVSRWSYLGLASLVVGLAIMMGIKPTGLNLGDGMILLATLLWSGEQIIAKKALREVSPVLVAWGRLFFGFIVILGFWLTTGQHQLLTSLNMNQIGWVVFTAVLLLGYVMSWYSGLKRLPVTVATSILTLGFPITALLKLIIDGQAFSLVQVGGLSLIIMGVVWVMIVNHQKANNQIRQVRL
ncbi:DMT family transporter [Patescibacteria group bacterium]|nr:DMT family transporter [Patescibacteria group bacterium]MBU1890403.1 DMT family transporter [Patescibacteria group bacterium]